jgi:lipopolysaccharide/colanic/teichoic acid biosynthesis glycosyltransferase
MYKFRSMYIDAEARKAALAKNNEMDGGVIFKMKHDPRITRVGRYIRRASIDELPQLWNVLKGDMSLVGPRPPVPSEVSQYTLSDRRRLEAKPGITCVWQVSGRSDIPFEQQVELDFAYIESQSLWMDIKLLLKTIPAVLLGRGAY